MRLPAVLAFVCLCSAASGGAPRMNALAREKSPYLLQHAGNPVDWLPWGEEAFERARREDKPIFLSIGYSTCHWCHVMETESFSRSEVASELNSRFVCVKVDREERPDVDALYMRAASGAGWGGGWPLNLWLTPELKPFYGGTYFPPEPRWGRPSLVDVSRRVDELWRSRRDDLLKDAETLAAQLREVALSSAAAAPSRKAGAAVLEGAFRSLSASFDAPRGGFGEAPKFPMPSTQSFLLRYHSRRGEKKALEMALSTLRAMAEGGIRDQLDGGFHRYSTDAHWRIPHFEKMLYDNAQLAVNYLEAYQASKDPAFARTARSILDYVGRGMTHPEGGFFSAEDADSAAPSGEKREGAFYLWTSTEVAALLGEERAALFAARYGVRPEGNALEDAQGEFAGKNVLYEALSLEEAAQGKGLTRREAERRLGEDRERLLQARASRPRPSLDDKVLASWNGLMISGFARGAQVLEDPGYLARAEKAARFLRSRLYDESSGSLRHSWRDGVPAVEGLAEDYAFVAAGALDLYEASFDPDWLDWSLRLSRTLLERFYDGREGGFYMVSTQAAAGLPARIMQDQDGSEPSAGSVAALTLLRLAQITDREDLRAAAEKTLARFGPLLEAYPRALPMMLCALDFSLSKPKQILIAGALDDPGTREMLRVVHSRYLPNRVLLLVQDEAARRRLSRHMPFVKGVYPIQGKASAYICLDFACEFPTNDPKTAADILEGKPARRRVP